jgi:type III pantothenate kinase
VPEPILLADVGNSRVKLRLHGSAEVTSFAWREDQQLALLRQEVVTHKPARIVIASTSPQASAKLGAKVWQGFATQHLCAEDLPLKLLSQGTGIDRLLTSWLLFEQTQSAVLVADCGTAVTLDFVDAQGCFHGGLIGAGLSLQEQALAQACPHLDAPQQDTHAIPRSTAAAVFAGTSGAMAASIETMAAAFESQAGVLAARFLSGGDAPRLHALLPQWQLRQDLVLAALSRFVSKAQHEA